MSRRRRYTVGLAVLASVAASVVIAPTAQAATLPLSGVVTCSNGAAVAGVYVKSSRGGSGWAETLQAFPGRPSAAKFVKGSVDTGSTAATRITLSIGCGKNADGSWVTTNLTPDVDVVTGMQDPAWLNADCSPAPGPQAIRCSYPRRPSSWASRPPGAANPGASGNCTWGASERWKMLTDVHVSWNGDARLWGTNARDAGYTTANDVPRLGALISIPPGSPPLAGAPEGHVLQVRDITFSGSRIIMSVLDMNGIVRGNWGTGQRDWTTQMTAIMAPWSPEGDANGDGRINLADLSILLSNYNTNYWRADFNDDGIVNITDQSILLSRYQS